ncbi:MAG: laccase domain-containing protein [Clostridium sp.]
MTFYADCVPLYFVDPVHRAVGLSHSGWRGTVHRMGKATLEAMNREYGTEPANVIACIGSSICQDCFEVGPEVAAEFADGFAEQYHNDLFYQKPDGKYQGGSVAGKTRSCSGKQESRQIRSIQRISVPAVQPVTSVFSPDHGNGAGKFGSVSGSQRAGIKSY